MGEMSLWIVWQNVQDRAQFKIHLSVSIACTQALSALNATTRARSNNQQDQECNDDTNVLPNNSSASVDANAVLDDDNKPWDCLQPWDSNSSSEEDSSDASTNDSISVIDKENTVVDDAKPVPNSGTCLLYTSDAADE